jgi:hypothetical protein
MLPTVFIASSREKKEVAQAIAEFLHEIAIPKPWFLPESFRPGEYPLTELLQLADECHFGFFVFGMEDIIAFRATGKSTSRAKKITVKQRATRDNVVFELGLFMGKRGARNSFIIIEKADFDEHLLSDLKGLTVIIYDGVKYRQNRSTEISFALREIRSTLDHWCVKEGIDLEKVASFVDFFGVGLLSSTFTAILPSIGARGLQHRVHTGSTENAIQRVDWIKGEEFELVCHSADLMAAFALQEMALKYKTAFKVLQDATNLQFGDPEVVISIGLANGETMKTVSSVMAQPENAKTKSKKPKKVGVPNGPKSKNSLLKTLKIHLHNGADRVGSTSNAYAVNDKTRGGQGDADGDGRYALIIRTMRPVVHQVSVPRFVCAGCSAEGTHAAAWFLVRRWEELRGEIVGYESYETHVFELNCVTTDARHGNHRLEAVYYK